MTESNENKPTRVRRDMVRELGEAVLDAVRGAVCDAIRNDPSFINRAQLQQAMDPHMAHAAKTVANSDDFQRAITDRLTADLFESLKPRAVQPEPSAPLEPEPEPEMPLVECGVEDCNRVGQSVNECQRASCPFTIKDDLPWR